MFQIVIRWRPGRRIVSLALLGGITLGAGLTLSAASQAGAAQAAGSERTWLTLDGQWLCRYWRGATPVATPAPTSAQPANGASGARLRVGAGAQQAAQSAQGQSADSALAGQTHQANQINAQDATRIVRRDGDAIGHCTQLWHIDAQGRLLSDAPDWTPNPHGDWPAAANGPGALDNRDLAHAYDARQGYGGPAPERQALVGVLTTKYAPPPAPHAPPASSAQSSAQASAPVVASGAHSPWAPVPGHPAYAMSDFAGDPWSGYFGVCTWYAWYRHQHEPLLRMGNAAAWAASAPGYGLHVGATPVVGSTVVFQPGVEGAGGAGHVAYVEQVLDGGWFLVSEMNFSINGGGFGRVDYRYAYAGPGVSFIS